MRQLLSYICLLVFASLSLACSQIEPDSPVEPVPDGEACDLEISFDMPKIELSTKGHFQYGAKGNNLVNDPFSDPSTWTSWERALDGQGMYRLTVLLISRDDGNKLVAYRNIYYTDRSSKGDITPENDIHGPNGWVSLVDGVNVAPTQTNGRKAKMTFLYDNPLHVAADGVSPEKLVRGTYRIVAFANCSAYPEVMEGQPGTVPYEGLHEKNAVTGQNVNFTKNYTEKIFEEFRRNYATPKPIREYINFKDFGNWMLETSEVGTTNHFITKPAPQPLTLIKDIELSPGHNKVELNLYRTFARVRITVENNSDHPLTLHDLKFSDNFTREKTYLFYEPDDPSRVYDIPGVRKGAPLTNSEHALVSFVKDSKVAAHSSLVVFDSYLLESQDKMNPYQYTLDMEYVGQNVAKQSYRLPAGYKAIEVYNSAELVDGGTYLIESANNSGYFLKANESNTIVNTNKDASMPIESFVGKDIDPSFVWKLQQYGTAGRNQWRIKTASQTPYYIGEPGGYGQVPLLPDALSYTRFSFTSNNSNNSNNYICMQYRTRTGVGNYLNVTGSKDLGGWSDNDMGSSFRFYRVVPNSTSPRYNKPITVKTIDPQTSFATELHTLKRNDFINIKVTVAYNKEKGDFEIEVKDWNYVQGEIEFN